MTHRWGSSLLGVLAEVQYARLHKHTSYMSQGLPREQGLAGLNGTLESTKANLEEFERVPSSYFR